MTGTNLTAIMETMKFAFHSTTYKDMVYLWDTISKANFTYTISSSMDMHESSYDVSTGDSKIS